MSGHNKWSQIKRKKEATDQHRSKEFGNIVREIKQAIRAGGEDPLTNNALRSAIERAKVANMPKAGIERAIARGAGRGDAGALQETIYEAYGPGGVAFLIEAHTDNKNRTVAEIKHILNTHGGTLAGAGSVVWMFKKGVPQTPLELDEDRSAQVRALKDALDEHEDVERVVTNAQNI